MAMTYLTKLKPEPMGAYSLSTAYGVNSLVMSEDGAAAYISVKDVPAGTPLTNTEYWKKHTDLTAVKQSAEAAAQKANAARNEMLEIARSLTDMVEKSGNPVQAELVGGLPFDRVATALSPIQAGSGDPSPSNIRTISGWTGAALTRCGKNLLNLSGAYVNGWNITNIPNGLKPNRQYVFSVVKSGGISFAVYAMTGLSAGESDKTVKLTESYYNENGYGTFTTPADITDYKYIVLAGSASGIASVFPDVKFQLELGSAATEYEPYQGDTYSADFGQTVYGGTLDWNTGVLTVDRALYTFDGSEKFGSTGWGNPYTYGLWNFLPNAVTYEMSDVADANCSHYVACSVDDAYNKVTTGFIIYASGNLIFSSPTHADADAFKSYLAAQYAAGTPVQVCYKLATPQTIQLTPQEIKQLQGMNTLYGDGSISMTGRADKALALEARIAALEAAG